MEINIFAEQVKKLIVEENTAVYQDLFENTESATDPYWIRSLSFYRSLNENQRTVLMEIIRQTAIDSISNLFGVLDGSADFEGQDGNFRLTCGDDELTGELQDSFLSLFE